MIRQLAQGWARPPASAIELRTCRASIRTNFRLKHGGRICRVNSLAEVLWAEVLFPDSLIA
jgi:hypothetical protein